MGQAILVNIVAIQLLKKEQKIDHSLFMEQLPGSIIKRLSYLTWVQGCTPNCGLEDFNQLLTLDIPDSQKTLGALLAANYEGNHDNFIGSLDILEKINSPYLDHKTTSIGLVCLNRKDYSSAIRGFKLVMQHGNATDNVIRQLSWAYEGKQDLHNEEAVLSILINQIGASSEDYGRLASVKERLNNYQDAEKRLLEGKEKFPFSVDLAIRLMWNAFKVNKIDLALERSSLNLVSFSNDSKANSESATLFFLVGDFEKARDLSAKAITLDGSNSQAHDILGQALSELDDRSNYSQSLQEFQIAVNLDPESYSYLTHLADLISNKDVQFALNLFEKALGLAKTADQVEYARKRIETLRAKQNP